ncbi:nucleotidyltransferase family protein [Streptomyces sp. NA04227]|uniref:nucleotidyltransferase family protein n=1 Tax=Streptomyces sp. NA04227 TaxID=2742136 RepID=UPI001591CA4A|nr:nucleotidyltransferase family protein [Streptomyces sp. NA04227]QKW10079.1 nucleotidyltransferase family protein [Streptomyces sp. NA04227]
MTYREQAYRPPAEVAGLVLAAGGGQRLGGRPKALLVHEGRTLVERAARALHAGGCAPVHVVLGAASHEVRRHAVLGRCVLVENPDWEEGMGSSLRAGLDALAATRAGAALVLLVDQPGIGAEAVRRVVSAYEDPGSLATATYEGRRGHPVLLGRAHWRAVGESAVADRGARDHLRAQGAAVREVECADVAECHDIDTEADLRLLAP